MAMLKTGKKDPLSIIASFTYRCANVACTYSTSVIENGKDENICPVCGSVLQMVSSNAKQKVNND